MSTIRWDRPRPTAAFPWGRVARGIGRIAKRKINTYYNSRKAPSRPAARSRGSGGSGRSGTVSVYRKRRMKLKPKTRKAITNVVHNVLNRKTATGKYTKAFTGNLLSMNNNNQAYFDRAYWHLTPPTGGRFECFTTEKIQDAVSVMFNTKAADLDPSLVVNNFDKETLKFHSQYMSYGIKLKNLTQVSWDVTIYELTPKHPSDTDALTDAINSLGNVKQVGGGVDAQVFNLNVDISTLASYKFLYDIKKQSKTLKPGDDMTHFVKSPAMDVLFKKFFEGGTVHKYQRFSKQFLIRVVPKITNAFDSTGVFSNAVGRFQRDGTISDKYCIGVETVEKFVYDAPENVTAANDQDVHCWKSFNPTIPDPADVFSNERQNYIWFDNVGSGPA